MSPSRARTYVWWLTRAIVPVIALGASAVLLGHANFDRSSLEPFFDPSTRTFPLRHSWFFELVLHSGGKWVVLVFAAALVVGAIRWWRSERHGLRARQLAYLVACFAATVSIAGLWKELADQVTPWDTVGFGGRKPWPVGAGFWGVLGSPGAHAASGFAWMSLYFVGASVRTRTRWLWLAPGLLLGLLFALGQHARGAHQPSHEPWSIAIAWTVACVFALAFRRVGWLLWEEHDDADPDDERTEIALPWLVGVSVGFCGLAFFATDLFTEQLEGEFAGLHAHFEHVEVAITGLGFGIAAWLLADRIQSIRTREARRVDEERERRFLVLGRMAASVAHEVRNPLQTLRLIVDEQRHEVAGLRDHPLEKEFESCLERIDRAVDLVYRLARPESGDADTVDLAQAARESVVALGRIHPDRVRFAWRSEAPRAVVASSRSALRIVLDNLLRNAIEASPERATVTLDLAARDGFWALRIENEGSLRPVEKPRGGESGLGLGVPISRQIAGNAGGRIDIEEADGRVHCTLLWPRETGTAA